MIKTKHHLLASEATFATLVDAMPQMVWSTLPDGYHDFYNQRWYEFTGMRPGSTDGEGWAGLFHPDDQPEAWKRWRHSLATGETYEVEYRLRHHSGAWRWTLGRALPVRDSNGEIVRWIGTCTDIDDAKRAAENSEILGHELSHRIKNIFQVIGGLIVLLSRKEGPDVRRFAEQLRSRVAALGRAHEFARPHSDRSRPIHTAVTLQGILQELFRPYPARDQGRITVIGDDAPIDDRGATPIAMVAHELATNAAKYGALSNEDGEVAIRIKSVDKEGIAIVWTETGGPALLAEPAQNGFGTRLIELSVCQQLGGEIERRWSAAGLEVMIRLDRQRLSRKAEQADGSGEAAGASGTGQTV